MNLKNLHVDFDFSIDTKSLEYQECIKLENPLYVRSMPPSCSTRKFLNFVKKLYEKNDLSKVKPKSNNIPKIIHQIWFGGEYPSEYYQFKESWLENHSSWKYFFWSEEDLKKEFRDGLYNQNLFEQAKDVGNFARMADIARYEILNRFGGLYVDCDCQCIKPFDILNECYDFYAGLENLANGLVVGNAIFASQPNHPIIQRCISNIKEYENKNIDFKYWRGHSGYQKDIEDEYALTLVTTGPILFLKSFWQVEHEEYKKKIKDYKNIDIIFPPTYFYPFAEGQPTIVKPETFACHYFKGIWKKRLVSKYEKKEIK
ncbi:hypothetical protein KAT08_00890 [Candidatus Babeliales bacterium]|nr:hypothetical protein [Candidatus Babeliales bacterium]